MNKLRKNNPSVARIQVRCTPHEYERIKEKAEEYGLSISDYVRMACLKSEIKIESKKGPVK